MLWFWTAFIALVCCLLALDLGVLNRRAHAPSIKEALGWTAGWISLGVLFSGVVFYLYDRQLLPQDGAGIAYSGKEAMLTYLMGFVLEESLSIDNLFVMVLIFRSYRIPTNFQHRVLFWGILGALVMRAIMIMGGVWLVTRFEWIMYVFGAYLLIQGLLQLRPEKDEDEADEPPTSFLERLLGRIIPVAREEVFSGRFLIQKDGKLHATLLLVALVSVEATDVVFALDSVPAVLTVSTDPFIVFTSNVFAILGLRSLYFVIAGMMDRFGHLKYALSAILVFVGTKMVVHKFFHVPLSISLTFIITAVLAGVLSSMWATRPSVQHET